LPDQKKVEPEMRPEDGKETQRKEFKKVRKLQDGASAAVLAAMTFVFSFEWDTSKTVSLVINIG